LYDIELFGIENKYDYEELIKIFLPATEYRILLMPGTCGDKKAAMRDLYEKLSEWTGKRPEWGTLTGVRPVKLAAELYNKFNDEQKVKEFLRTEYLLAEEKAELLISIFEYQREILTEPPKGQVSVYISIPFCPTRCLYCSFASNPAAGAKIIDYMEALYKEIKFAGTEMREARVKPETVYIGGGTPTALSASDMEKLLSAINENFDLSELKEFTVEAGRPDTITPDKLRLIKSLGVERISINPQSMNEKTLKLIGRSHTAEDAINAYYAAKHEKIDIINMDIIAGLPEENAGDFINTTNRIAELSPENVTVHTLAVKRASKLIEQNKDYHYEKGELVREMLHACNDILLSAGYRQYYLYRQKHMAGNYENTGWCKQNTAGVYNIRMMEEKQTVVAFGAGGISKVYYPDENRLERVPNIINYELYISRIDEMIKRKKEQLFNRREINVDKRA